LIGAGTLAGQTQVAPDQCLGGSLTATQSQSISLRFNGRITTIPIAPGAEIWRGGDLNDIHQLIVGDEIYLKCTRAGEGAPVMATVVAAVEPGDGIQLVPHHITERSACLGRLIAVTGDTLSLKNDKGGCVIHTNEVSAGVTVSYPGRILPAE
jgi:hypothetical protein